MKTFLIAILLVTLPARLAWSQGAPGLDVYRAAIERELAGVDHDGEIFVALHPDGSATVTYTYGDGYSVGRTVALPPRYDDAIELVALLAASLVRAQLPAAPAAEPPPRPAAAPAVPPSAAAPPPTHQGDQPVLSPSESAPTAPALPTTPAPSPASSPAPSQPPPGAPRIVPMSASLFWSVGTDALYDRAVVPRVGLHLIAGVGVGVRGVSISAAIDAQRGLVHGAQVAGAAAWATRLRGAQLAGAWSSTFAGAGLQASGGATLAHTFHGAQLAGGLATVGHGRGLQASGGVAVARSFRGAQLAGGLALAETSRGAQLAGGVAVAERVHGLQLSVVNVARSLHGLQLGLINYADRSDGVSLGLINLVRNGLVELDAGVESNGLSELRLRHGTRALYSTYHASTTADRTAYGVGLGLGSRLGRVGPVALDADASVTQLFGDAVSSDLALLARPRLIAAVSLGAVALWATAGANVLVTDAPFDAEALHPTMAREWMSQDVTTRLWPSAGAGLRVVLR